MRNEEACARRIRIADYSYNLPAERIAQHPVEPPESARLLVHHRGEIHDTIFAEIGQHLPPGTLLIGNDTRVIHARLHFRKPTGGHIEILLLSPSQPSSYAESLSSRGVCEWNCLVGNARRWHDGPVLLDLPGGGQLEARRAAGRPGTIRFTWPQGVPFSQVVEGGGSIPIPPYLGREVQAEDDQWYQTAFAQAEGSVAAPTAGLHFSHRLLAQLQNQGHHLAYTTLHVGAGTFLPVKSEEMGGHTMHTERIIVSQALIEHLHTHRGPRVAIGTTSLRALESLYLIGRQCAQGQRPPFHVTQWAPYQSADDMDFRESIAHIARMMRREGITDFEASTSLLIVPGHPIRSVEGLITNFHQPRSTLLLLVGALVGNEWRPIYEHALREGYRFLSYGDGMLLWRE